ncbi:unnamed protein product, partial [Didymodactylos carnosus]
IRLLHYVLLVTFSFVHTESVNSYGSNAGMRLDQVNQNYGQAQIQSQISKGSNYDGNMFRDQSRPKVVQQTGTTFQRSMMFDQQQGRVAGIVQPDIKFLEDLKGSVNEISLEEKLANMSSNYVFDFKNAQ